MPFLNDEVREWIALELQSLGVEDLAVYALEAGKEGDERRIMVATEVGLLDHRYAAFGSSARYRLAMLMYPWQVLRGVELRADTFRLWAREHRTRWSFRLHHPNFEAATESADLGQALCDLARVCAVMAEPFGVPAGRASSEVPGAIPGGPRPMPPSGDSVPTGPGRKSNGTKAKISVAVAPSTATPICLVAAMDASRRGTPARMNRVMFSTTTMESSTSRPRAITKPTMDSWLML